MGNWSADEWQTAAAVGGAATGVLALLLSGLALWISVAGARTAALVITWRADGRVTLENRGPSAAREVLFEVTSPGQRTLSESEPEHMRFEIRKEIARLRVGYSYEDSIARAMMVDPSNYVAKLTWRDGRLRRQHMEVAMSQEEKTLASKLEPVLGDRQVSRLADGLAAGIAPALLEHLENRARRNRNAGGW